MPSITLVQKVQIKNRMGLHTRPATVIVKLLQNSKSDVVFEHRKQSVDARSILHLLMLAASKNSQITIKVTGEDAKETMNKLIVAFHDRFGEDNATRSQ